MRQPREWRETRVAEIRSAEAEAIAREGEDALMDRAAAAVAVVAQEMLGGVGVAGVGVAGAVVSGRAGAGARVVVLAGRGNNGGDALLAGAALARAGASVTAIPVFGDVHERGARLLADAGGALLDRADARAVPDELIDADLVIDGIAGLGSRPGLAEPAAALVAAIPDRTPVLAVDLPSGLDADSSVATLAHVRATRTVAFTAPTACLLLPPAALDAGRVTVVDVGIPAPVAPDRRARRLTPAGVAALWPVPLPGDDKYSRGVVGVIAGSSAYPGAAVLACSAAVRAGAGMVRYLGPDAARSLVLAARPEVVAIDAAVAAAGRADLPRASAWILGPGVGDDPSQRAACDAALRGGEPCVVDAGEVERFAGAVATGERVGDPARALLTPHAGELRRALAVLGRGASAEEITADPAHHALALAEATGATVLLKGAVTVVAAPDGEIASVAEAPAWLATAGAGDVLAGIAGALLATGLAPLDAGAVAAHVHGAAARAASGGGPIAALDVAEALGGVVDALPAALAQLLDGDREPGNISAV